MPGKCDRSNKLQIMGIQPFYGRGPQQLFWADSRATRGRITLSDTSNRLNYCVICIVRALLYYNCPSINTTIILKMIMLVTKYGLTILVIKYVIFKIIAVFIEGQL